MSTLPAVAAMWSGVNPLSSADVTSAGDVSTIALTPLQIALSDRQRQLSAVVGGHLRHRRRDNERQQDEDARNLLHGLSQHARDARHRLPCPCHERGPARGHSRGAARNP